MTDAVALVHCVVSASYCVVGGGISGLVAAYRLRVAAGPDASITVFDPADRLGGVLRTERVGGQPVDVGAEAFIARRPEVPALLAELGLAARQIGTTGVRPLIYSEGPAAPDAAGHAAGHPCAGRVAGRAGRRRDGRADRRRAHPAAVAWRPGADPSVAELVGDRFGEQVVTRSVDPLLAGVYAGSAATIGLRVGRCRRWPPRWTAVRAASPTRCARRFRRRSAGSVFGAVDGGYAVLVDELVRRADIRWAQVAVERVDRAPQRLGTGRRRRGALARRRAWCWRCPRPGCRVWSSASRRGPRRRPGASRWPRRRWWCWRCRAAPRCPSSPACWWPAENGCTPRR